MKNSAFRALFERINVEAGQMAGTDPDKWPAPAGQMAGTSRGSLHKIGSGRSDLYSCE